MNPRLPLFFILLCSTAVQAEPRIATDDLTIIPGQRVGAICKGMRLFGLRVTFGYEAVKLCKLDGAEGEQIDGAKLWEGTERELEILFNPESSRHEIWTLRIIGKAWKFQNGLKFGMSIAEVEKLNGAPFTVSGFDWDYGGYCDFTGGALADAVSVRFSTTGDTDASLSSDRPIASTNKKLRAAKVEVSDIAVDFR